MEAGSDSVIIIALACNGLGIGEFSLPEIARFYGIIIRIFYEFGYHQLPHIHAAYNDFLASYSIDPPALLAGTLPRRQQNLVIAWIELHQEELLENWNLISRGLPPNNIEGLR